MSLPRPSLKQDTLRTCGLRMPASISGSSHQCGTKGGQLQTSANKAVLVLSDLQTSIGGRYRRIDGLSKTHHTESARFQPAGEQPGKLRSPLVQQAVSKWGGPSHRPESAPLSSQPIGICTGNRSWEPPTPTFSDGHEGAICVP